MTFKTSAEMEAKQTTRKPPIKCTPCRVKYQGIYYKISSNGEVRETWMMNGIWQVDDEPLCDYLAKLIRQEASRLRRNRNARERAQAMRDLGMKRTPYGWE